MSHEDDRAQLRFAEVARAAFDFLRPYGFRHVRDTPTFVRYESERLFVNVLHGRRSFELHMEIGRLNNERDAVDPFTLESLIRLADPAAVSSFRYATARSPELVARGVHELAMMVQRYGGRALRGETEIYQLLEDQATRVSQDYELSVRVRQVLPLAEQAFRRRDYATAARLLRSIDRGLSPVDLKKLEYAEKQAK